MQIYYDNDADFGFLQRQKRWPLSASAPQGHAQALNLRDSGVDVVVSGRYGDTQL